MKFFQLNDINHLAVLVSAIVYYILGFVWYTLLFGELWAKETGVIMPDKPNPLNLIGQFISTYLYVLGIAVLIVMSGEVGVSSGLFIGLLVTLVFAIPINSGNLFFTNRKKLFFLDVTERAIGSVFAGIIIGLWG